MVKITPLKSYAPSRIKKKDKTNTQSAFSVDESENDISTGAISAPQSMEEIASLSQLMQIQEVNDRDHEIKRAVVSSETILESLERLQNEILTGSISKSSLRKIVDVTNTLPSHIADPNLKQIVAEIKQRAMVEITKIEMSQRETGLSH